MYLFKFVSQTKSAGDLILVFSLAEKGSSAPDVDDYYDLYTFEVRVRGNMYSDGGASILGFEIHNPHEQDINWLHFTFIGKFMKFVQERLCKTSDFTDFYLFLGYESLFYGN